MVQAGDDWWNTVKSLKYVDSQEEFATYLPDLARYEKRKWFHHYLATRKYLFLARFWTYTTFLRFHF